MALINNISKCSSVGFERPRASLCHLAVSTRGQYSVHRQPAASLSGSLKYKQNKVCIRRIQIARVAADGPTQVQIEVLVEEVMNPHPTTLDEEANIKDAVRKMLDANVSGAPVVDAAGKLVGVLTEADIIWKGAGRPEDHYIIPPVFIGFADAFIYLRDNKQVDEEINKILARTVSQAMVKKDKIISVNPGTPMSEAAHLMLHHDINLLPVVEADNSVVGVVTRHDILRGLYASKSPLL